MLVDSLVVKLVLKLVDWLGSLWCLLSLSRGLTHRQILSFKVSVLSIALYYTMNNVHVHMRGYFWNEHWGQ